MVSGGVLLDGRLFGLCSRGFLRGSRTPQGNAAHGAGRGRRSQSGRSPHRRMVGGLNAGELGPGGGRTRRLKTPLRRALPATGIRSATEPRYRRHLAYPWRSRGEQPHDRAGRRRGVRRIVFRLRLSRPLAFGAVRRLSGLHAGLCRQFRACVLSGFHADPADVEHRDRPAPSEKRGRNPPPVFALYFLLSPFSAEGRGVNRTGRAGTSRRGGRGRARTAGLMPSSPGSSRAECARHATSRFRSVPGRSTPPRHATALAR